MSDWLRRIRGALGLGLTWAVLGALMGGAIELLHNIWPNQLGAAVDIWPMALAVPGLLGGVAFSGMLAIAGRHRRFDELSLGRVALWGAAGGVIVALIPAGLVLIGAGTANVPVWSIVNALAGPLAVGGAVAAAASLAMARTVDDRQLLEESQDVAATGLTPEEKRELLS